jgi:hypothetical protein
MNPFAIARHNATKILISWGCLAVAVVLISKPCSSGERLIETTDWSLPQFVDHLHAQGLALHVVTTHKSGNWSNSIYLTTDSSATWDGFQRKLRMVDKFDQWQGVVLVERMLNNSGPQWDVGAWGENGLQIDRFVLFGDADLIKQVHQSVLVARTPCKLAQWLSSH